MRTGSGMETGRGLRSSGLCVGSARWSWPAVVEAVLCLACMWTLAAAVVPARGVSGDPMPVCLSHLRLEQAAEAQVSAEAAGTARSLDEDRSRVTRPDEGTAGTTRG